MNVDKTNTVTTSRRYKITKLITVENQVFRATTDAGGSTEQDIFGLLTAMPGEVVEMSITATVLGRKAKPKTYESTSVRNPHSPLAQAVRGYLRVDTDTRCDPAWRAVVASEVGSTPASVGKSLVVSEAHGYAIRSKPGWYRLRRTG